MKRTKPKRGRKRTPESIKRRLNTIKNEYDDVDPVTQLKFTQERLDLAIELAELYHQGRCCSVGESIRQNRQGIRRTQWHHVLGLA